MSSKTLCLKRLQNGCAVLKYPGAQGVLIFRHIILRWATGRIPHCVRMKINFVGVSWEPTHRNGSEMSSELTWLRKFTRQNGQLDHSYYLMLNTFTCRDQEYRRIFFTITDDNITFVIITDDVAHFKPRRVHLVIPSSDMVHYYTSEPINTVLYNITLPQTASPFHTARGALNMVHSWNARQGSAIYP